MIQWNLWMSPTPAAMNAARMTRAPRIPQNRTLCWWTGGTWKKRKISRKTKRLSTLRESSMTYPVTNSSIGVRPCQKKTATAKMAARAIQTALQSKASRNLTVWGRRWNTPKSSTSIARTKRLNKIQNSSNERPEANCVGRTLLSATLDFDFILNHAAISESNRQNLRQIKFKGGGRECQPYTFEEV